jgi:hypothetical protein
MNEGQIAAIGKYFYAIQNNNLALFKEVMLPLFEPYIQADTETSAFTIADWLQMLYDYAFNLSGGNFEFFEVEVLYYDDKDMTGHVGSMLDDLYKITDFEVAYNAQNGITENKLSKKNVHAVLAEARLTSLDGEYKYTDNNLYIFEVDGEYKIMTIS